MRPRQLGPGGGGGGGGTQLPRHMGPPGPKMGGGGGGGGGGTRMPVTPANAHKNIQPDTTHSHAQL